MASPRLQTITSSDQHNYIRDKQSKAFYSKFYVGRQERLDLVKETGSNGLLGFEYYLKMASIDNIEVCDQDLADYYGWNVHTAKRTRLALMKFDYYHKEVFKHPQFGKSTTYYLGKEAVGLRKAHLSS
jgi:hypothetical protein